MTEMENIEIRVCLIGEEKVGKKSIISRFKILNSSMTLEDPKMSDLKKGELKDLKEITKNLTDSFFSKNYIGGEKLKLQSLINFTKVMTISNTNIELKFFPISPADNIDFSDKVNEEDEALREHKLKFDNMKSELERIIMMQPRNPLAEVKILFLFVIDKEKFKNSFEKVKIYYDELNKYLNIDKQYYKAFLMNKVDLEFSFPKKKDVMKPSTPPEKVYLKPLKVDTEELDQFLTSQNFNFYEISTKMSFNFEKFFEKLFFDVLESSNPSFSTVYFKERFNFIMNLRPSFARGERTSIKSNEVPGPQKYDSNVYNIEQIKPVFGKDRFKKKIFVNKKGPIFDFKNEVFLKKQNKTAKSTKAVVRNPAKVKSREEKENFETAEKKRKLKDEMFGHSPGFSLGIKPSKMNIRQKRKEEYKQMMRSFENIFDLDNITRKENEVTEKSQESDNDNKERKKVLLKQRIENFKMKRKKVHPPKPKQDTRRIEMKTASKSGTDEDTHTEEKSSHTERGVVKRNMHRARSHRIVKKEPFIVPGPASYDVRGKISIDKGYTFGGRYNLQDKNNYGPGYLYLESDIDQMLKQPKFAAKKSFAPRFKDPTIQIPGDAREIEQKLKYMEENKLNELSKNNMKMREWDRKREEAMIRKEDKDEMHYRKLEEGIIKREEKERLKRISKGLRPLEPDTIYYNQVEETAPMYSIKGRYEKGFLGVQDNFDDPSKLHGLEQSVSYLSKNLTKNLNPLPNYNTIKQNLPAFSMPRAERFEIERDYKRPGPNSYFPDDTGLFEKKPGSFKQTYMGTGRRFKEFEFSYIPGPGMYKLRGFSDDVLLEAEKRLKMRKDKGPGEEMRMDPFDDMMEMIENDQSFEERETKEKMSSNINTYEEEKVTI